MATNNTLQEVLSSIDEFAQRANISRDKAFAAWYAVNFYAIDEDEALEAASADGGNDQGIDIVFIDEASEALIVLQAHCPSNTGKVTPKSKWDATVSSIPFVKNPEALRQAGRADLAQMLEAANEDHRQLTLTVGLISLGSRSNEIDNSVAVTRSSDQDISYFYSDQSEIISQYKAIMLDGGGIPEDTIQFIGNYFEDRGDYGRAIIGAVSASELQRLHKDYPQELFAGNIRFF